MTLGPTQLASLSSTSLSAKPYWTYGQSSTIRPEYQLSVLRCPTQLPPL